jgi:CopG family nickel-responsive transcriptional regulator
MQRITITLDDDLADALGAFMAARGYENRSEALRDLARMGMQQAAESDGAIGPSAAALAYVCDHDVRDLARRLAALQHDRHDLATATLAMPLDHHSRLEVALLRGPADAVRQYAEQVFAERGVRHGRLTLIPVEPEEAQHAHGEHSHPHVHLKVRDSF